MRNSIGLCLLFLFASSVSLSAQDVSKSKPPSFDPDYKAYFAAETAKLSENCLNDLTTLPDWKTRRFELRGQLFEMLGLDPLPEKTDLNPVITKTTDGDGFKVHCLHFQSRPGLYVTGNLYLPEKIEGKLPTILYLCGHGGVKENGVSYGNKVHYQHHGAWFARNGYACLTIDSLQLGEIEGIHHGTYRYGMWWWINRGYTPAGVEAWNCIRALDFLATRPEIDMERIGVTGRSGGGIYSWWIAALDERIKVAVPVAGITDLENYVVDGCVEGHCDCMFLFNTYRWDYPTVASLVAPRPLLISNTDRDRIFPLDGVVRTHEKVRNVYGLYGKPDDVALNITAGPHKDTQELRVHAFRWFNHYLKNDDELIRMPAEQLLDKEQLRVFDELPSDSINAKIHDTFVPQFETPPVPKNKAEWQALKAETMKNLHEKTFRGWPEKDSELEIKLIDEKEISGVKLCKYQFESQPGVPLDLFTAQRIDTPEVMEVKLSLGHDSNYLPRIGWQVGPMETVFSNADKAKEDGSVFLSKWFAGTIEKQIESGEIAPNVLYVDFGFRGAESERNGKEVALHVRRRFLLLGQSLDAMRVYDVRRGIHAVRTVAKNANAKISIYGGPDTDTIGAFAALFEDDIDKVAISRYPQPDKLGPFLPSVSRIANLQLVAAMLGDETKVYLRDGGGKGGVRKNDFDWSFTKEVDRALERETLVVE